MMARTECPKQVTSGWAPPSITARSEHSRTRQWRRMPQQGKGAPPEVHMYVRDGPRNGRAGVAAARRNIRVRVSPHNSRALATGNCRQPVRVVL